MSKLPMKEIKNGRLGMIDMTKVEDTSLADESIHVDPDELKRVATKYASLARALRINREDMDDLKLQHANSLTKAKDSLAGVIELYRSMKYDHKYGEPTWKGLVYAVFKENPALARTIATNHPALPVVSPKEETSAAHYDVRLAQNEPSETAPNEPIGHHRYSDSFLSQPHSTQHHHGRTQSEPRKRLAYDPRHDQPGPTPPATAAAGPRKLPKVNEQQQSVISRSQMVVTTPPRFDQIDTHAQDDQGEVQHPSQFETQTSDPVKNTQPSVPLPNRSISTPDQKPVRGGRGRSSGCSRGLQPPSPGLQPGHGGPRLQPGRGSPGLQPRGCSPGLQPRLGGRGRSAAKVGQSQNQGFGKQAKTFKKDLTPPTQSSSEASTIKGTPPPQSRAPANYPTPLAQRPSEASTVKTTVSKPTPPTQRSNQAAATAALPYTQTMPRAQSNTFPPSGEAYHGTHAPPPTSKLTGKNITSKPSEEACDLKDYKKASKYDQHVEYSPIPPEGAFINVPRSNPLPTAQTTSEPYTELPANPAAAGAPPPITPSSTPGTNQALRTPSQTQLSEVESYCHGQIFTAGQPATFLNEEDSLASGGSFAPPSSESTLETEQEQETLPSSLEQESGAKPVDVGSSVVASVQSNTGEACFVVGCESKSPTKFDNASLVSTAVPVVSDENASLVYQNKVKKVRQVPSLSSVTSDPDRDRVSVTTGHPINQVPEAAPNLQVRSPQSIASSQSVDRVAGKGGAPKTMELIEDDEEEEEVRLKSSHFEATPPPDAITMTTSPHNNVMHAEPVSSASTMQHENERPTGYQEGDSFSPSEAGGSTQHAQCSSMPPAGGSPRQPVRTEDHQTALDSLPEAEPSDGQQELEEQADELQYATLLQRDDECDGIRCQSFEAVVTEKGRPRYKKVELSFESLCPNKTQRVKSEDDDYYSMENTPHGLALIINNEHFLGHSRREGTNLDEKNLVTTLCYLGYDVKVYRDLTKQQIESLFAKMRERDLSASDSFVCCILTHGESGRVIGADSLSVPIEILTENLSASSCPQLKGKPKIFFVQACRGTQTCHRVSTDSGSEQEEAEQEGDNQHDNSGSEQEEAEPKGDNSGSEQEDEVDGGAQVIQDPPRCQLRRAITRSLSLELDPTPTPQIESDSSEFPDVADFFFGYATPHGHVSWRDCNHGSWYISEVCRHLCTFCGTKSLLDIMIKVHNGVGDRYYYKRYKQAPETTHRLRKKVLF